MTMETAQRAAARRRRVPWKPLVIVGLMAGCTVLHLVSPPTSSRLHDFYFKITYIQIILAALWYGKRGGLLVSLLTSLIYAFHITFQLAPHGAHHQFAILYDIVLYNIIAVLVGTLADRQNAARRRLEMAKRDLETSLRKLQEQAAALLRAETELRESHRLKIAGQLAAEFAHEVRNPLGGILGAAEILTRDGVPAATREEFSSMLDREVRRLDGVVASFLNLARRRGAQSGGTTVQATLSAVQTLLSRQLESNHITLEVDDRTAGATLAISTEHGCQVLLNLLLNAIDAMPDGGSIRASAAVEAGHVVLRLADGGPGVPRELYGTLFEPFVSGRAHGTGLGLAIVRRLLEETGGQVTLVPEPGPGAVFVLEIPLQETATA